MKIKLLYIGKTDRRETATLTELYIRRIQRHLLIETVVIPDLKNRKSLSEQEQKKKEGEAILKILDPKDYAVLLDENGDMYSSRKFADWLNQKMISGVRNLVFVTGGPYGFSHEVYQRADKKLSLSAMTFSHQLVRIVFAEQLYRALSIIRNEPYHHD